MQGDRNKLRIVHCFRSPVGGIFRHVRDLVKAQSAEGHDVGILCDSSTGGEYEDKLFEEIKPFLSLGITRIPMRRTITPADLITLWKSYKELKKLQPEVLHSHSAKGGAYARIIGSMLRVSGNRVARLYCPHGGSIHYDGKSLKGKLFFTLERFFERMTDRLVFVSKYERDGYIEKVGSPRCDVSLIYNGLGPGEFDAVTNIKQAADFLYIGMMRDLKGADVFLEAISKIKKTSNENISAHFVGDGPDKDEYIKTISELGLENNITVHAAMPARKAFALAKHIVVPSRAESMPYIVLEAIAAKKPIICTNVGGIPEIFEGSGIELVTPGDPTALANAMTEMAGSKNTKANVNKLHGNLRKRFSVDVMVKDIMAAYNETLSNISNT